MVLGETDKQEAVKATIAIQNTYRLSNAQLSESINFLNTVQDSTSTSFKDLIDSVPRVGPIIKNLGGSYKDVAAMLVAMKEGGVGVAEGANALKNSFGRMINPTKAASDMLKQFGININQLVEEDANNPVKLITDLQKALDKLSPLQRSRAIAELFGKFQFARMTALFDNFNRTGSQSAMVMGLMGASAKQLEDTTNRHIKRIQESTSGKFKITLEMIKTDLLPIGQAFLKVFTNIMKAIDPVLKFLNKMTMFKGVLVGALTLTAVIGPLIMTVGLMANLVANIGRGALAIKMFRDGFKEAAGGGGFFTRIKAGFAGLNNFFVEADKAALASEALYGTVSADAASAAEKIAALTIAVREYQIAVDSIMNGKRLPGLIPTGGITSPGSIVSKTSVVNAPYIAGGVSTQGSRGYGLYAPSGAPLEALHFSPYKATAEGTNVFGNSRI
jgi:TP901 family phage tail tape measure protein